MITHIVLVRWASQDPAVRRGVEHAVMSLPSSIPQILEVRSGASNSPEGLESGYEWGFVMRFDDEASRDSYLEHPAHRPVARLIDEATSDVLVFDL